VILDMITIIYDTTGEGPETNLRIFFDPEESASPYEITIPNEYARHRFIEEMDNMQKEHDRLWGLVRRDLQGIVYGDVK
jgi:hypothetical protein